MSESKKDYRDMLLRLKKSFVADVVSLKKDTQFELFIMGILNDASAILGERVVFTASSMEPIGRDDN